MESKTFQENILFHYRHPRNKGELKGFTFSARDTNPLCGDEVTIQVKIRNGKVEEAKFEGSGCAISQASASLLTDYLKDKSVQELRKIGKEEVFKLIGTRLSPVRMRCALLPLRVLKEGLFEHLKEPEELKRARHEIG